MLPRAPIYAGCDQEASMAPLAGERGEQPPKLRRSVSLPAVQLSLSRTVVKGSRLLTTHCGCSLSTTPYQAKRLKKQNLTREEAESHFGVSGGVQPSPLSPASTKQIPPPGRARQPRPGFCLHLGWARAPTPCDRLGADQASRAVGRLGYVLSTRQPPRRPTLGSALTMRSPRSFPGGFQPISAMGRSR